MSSNSENSEDFLAKWLSGELSSEEKIQFESTDEARDLQKILNSMDKLSLPSYDVEAELEKLNKAKTEVSQAKSRDLGSLWKLAVAAILIIGVSLVYFLTKPNYTVYETDFGETLAITLPDNSVVTLNVNSTLKFDPDSYATNRKLLLEGEAFFEVTKGINFQVNTSQGNVIVMGTSFNVKQRTKNLDVQVYTGVVNVVKNSIDRILERGDGLRIEDGSLEKSWALPVNAKPLWVTDSIIELNDVPLREALESLKNSFGIRIQSNISLTSERYTGSYPANNAEAAIQIVLSTNKVEYEYDAAAKKLTITGLAEN